MRYPLLCLPLIFVACAFQSCERKAKTDRYALVTRHNILHSNPDPLNSLTAGNGKFAFTVDITGLQSFPGFHEKGIPLGTHSDAGWHSFPNPSNYSLEDVYKKYRVGDDSVNYVYQYTDDPYERKNEASRWLRENRHRLHLGIIGLEIMNDDTAVCTIDDIKSPVQQLNLWTGEINSRFQINGFPVEVITFCHQDLNMVAFRITSVLVSGGKVRIKIRFPYGSHIPFGPSGNMDEPGKHTTAVIDNTANGVVFHRQLDDDHYYVKLRWNGSAEVQAAGAHEYLIVPSDQHDHTFEVSCLFTDEKPDNEPPGFIATRRNNKKRWKEFWLSGGAVDFSHCTDPRAVELERRVVLSQYLTRIQCAGSLPPQETGLTFNSWYGKFHLEMHWWHAVHFILWNRAELMEKQMDYYFRVLERARGTAAFQGYRGARWPKMVDPDGRESPSKVGTFLIWQQPHLIYLAELLYHYYKEDPAVLEKYKDLVFETTEFIASYARMDTATNRYVLGPALIPAQECFSPETTLNPAFELAYWRWALQTALLWKRRLGQPANSTWQIMTDKLAPLPVKDSLYLFTEDATDCYSNPRYLTDHPMVLAIMGFLPNTGGVDETLLKRSLEAILERWNLESIWGWDPPMMAMTAASLGLPDLAVDILMMDVQKNTYLMNGHNYQDNRLPVYLPGNGALLTAVAMMCTHQSNGGLRGFPANGKWNIKYENINRLY